MVQVAVVARRPFGTTWAAALLLGLRASGNDDIGISLLSIGLNPKP